MIDKESYFKNVVNRFSDKHNLNYEERTDLLNTLTAVFSDVEMSTKDTAVGINVSPNETIIKNFLGIKQLSGKKPSTLRNYNHALHFFVNNSGYDLLNTTTNDLRRYLLWYENLGNSKISTDNLRRVLNIFFQFMEDEGYISKNPCKRIPRIKCDKCLRHFLTDTEVEAMRDACKNIREKAMIDFLTSTGVRVSEMSNIKLKEINWDKKEVLIHGKGGKDRYVYLNAKAYKHIKDYLGSRPESEWLFTQGQKPYDRLKVNTINHILSTIGKRVGIDNVTVHNFRRWFANDLNRKSVDIRIIQQLLGHENFATTQGYYLQTENEKAKQVHQIYMN